ncbi:MAG: DUF1453 family protein [Azospirillaceae bacterium]|nr:DUF1453 family protein [Azospirillaceae bacterium]
MPYLFMAAALLIMVRRTRVWRRVRPPFLAIVPLLLLALVTFYAWGAGHLGPHVTPLGWLAIAGGLLAGVGCGAVIGRLVHLAHDPDTGHVTMRLSLVGFAVLLGLLVIRQAARQLGVDPASTGPGAAFSLMSDVLIAVALGTVLSRQFVLWRRWRALVTAPSPTSDTDTGDAATA